MVNMCESHATKALCLSNFCLKNSKSLIANCYFISISFLNFYCTTHPRKSMISWSVFWTLTTFYLSIGIQGEHVRELEVSEGVPVGYQIGFIGKFVDDVDSGPPYLIVPAPGSGADTDLLIDQTTGEIRTKLALDRETRSSYSLVAIPLSGENIRILIRVLDENDNAPTFPTEAMNIEFPENTPRDVKRTLHPARDLDLGQYNTQIYNIISGNTNNAFRLSSHRERDGVLYLDLQINGFLDRETTPSYSLVIEALDGGIPPKRGVMTVNITIQDVNDNQPIFNQSRYFATIAENATVGSSVVQIYASDTDLGENGRVEYSINRRQSDKNEIFRIDSHTGLITVNKPLDFESKELHELVVVAKDNGEQPLQTTAFVSIRVTDVNDNQPTINVIFLSDDGTPKISESAKPGEFVARISVNDPDSKPKYSNVNVSLNGGDGHFGLTTLDNSIYLVIVNLTLDRELEANYTLTVVATDNGSPTLHASKTIFLRVTDVNDNAPEFEKTIYTANVMEEADPGTTVLKVTAFDRDEGSNSAVVYMLADTPDTHSEWFQIDSHTGLITTLPFIDCEIEPAPKLTVIARDNGHPPLSSSATVLVTIHDINDNEPIFDQSFYNVSVPENEPVGKCILKVSASDPDCGVNSVVNYTLADEFMHITKFEVRPSSGEICIVRSLDYEQRSSYELAVVAVDKGGLKSSAMVKIQLLDVNDNRPIFYPETYNVSLHAIESNLNASTPIVSVAATDNDSGYFSTVSYYIVSGNNAAIYQINGATGEIFIKRPNLFSTNTQATHTLNISATDGGGLLSSNNALVFINIINDKERRPLFEKPRYNFRVMEDTPTGTIIGDVFAYTFDSVIRGAVQYSIYSGDPSSYFTIDSSSGTIRVKNQLDYEVRQHILLNIRATSGNTSFYDHTQVNIEVLDVNDNTPEFDTSLIRISVPENFEIGAPLYSAHACDRDSNEAGEVTYSIIVLTAKIENVSAEAMKMATERTINNYKEANSSSVQFFPHNSNIRLLKKMDLRNANIQVHPQLSPEFSVDVWQKHLFVIDSRSGHLTLARELDYEILKHHTIVVIATDKGQPPLSANLTVIVEVQDVNDNSPIFEQSKYLVEVLESLPIDSQILRVTATDLDTGNNARISYRIVSKEQNSTAITKSSSVNSLHRNSEKDLGSYVVDTEVTRFFRIFPNSGWIYLQSSLDRESKDYYEFDVKASDNGIPAGYSYARVVINVLDINDNDPRFVSDKYEFTVEENSPRGTFVGALEATDVDIGKNAELKYTLNPPHPNFHVNVSTGRITTKAILDREKHATYDLIAEARDQGNPSRSARVPIKVHVTDVNDNVPEIVDPQEDVVSVREEQPPGTEVVQVRAIDPDNGKNGSISYFIIKGKDSDGYNEFSIDKQTGIIRTLVTLHNEERSIYRLAIAAKDGGDKQSVRLLRVEVLDINDNRPTFSSSSLVFRVREDAPVGNIIGFVGPIEKTQTVLVNTDNPYTLKSLAKDVIEHAFIMDRQTGSLLVARQLDREIQSEFCLEIRALDESAANKPQSSAITVKIEIADINDNAPQWNEDPITIKVSEATLVGSMLYKFTAIDNDIGSNAEVRYKLMQFSENGETIYSNNTVRTESKFSVENVFAIDFVSGELTLREPLDFETKKEFILQVQALDQSSNITERLTTTVTAIVQVTDVNDNAPYFVYPNSQLFDEFGTVLATIYVSESTCVGDTITHIVATDNDDGENGRITFDFVSGNADGYFLINTKTGSIELNKPLTLAVGDSSESFFAMHNNTLTDLNRTNFTLIISASDHGSSPMQSLLSLQIIVQGATFNPPRFLQDVYYANITENAPVGTFVLQVVAKLSHDSTEASFVYEIPPGIASKYLHIDKARGIITTRTQFDREERAQYTIPIYVTHSNNRAIDDVGNSKVKFKNNATTSTATGRMQRSSLIYKSDSLYREFDVATIVITINDINDNAPQFPPNACYNLFIPENSDFAVVHTITAIDLDEGANGKISYSIVGGNEENMFSLDTNSGELAVQPLDREQQSHYILQIQAEDRGAPFSYQTHCNISIVVNDLNDNDPQFEQSKYIASIPENIPVNTTVAVIKATDADLDNNGQLTYAIANETTWIFAINRITGRITTAGPLDRERVAVYNFMVVVTDGGYYNARSAHVSVQINIEDVNDNKPIFEKYPFFAQLPTFIQPGQMLIQVSAIDSDSGKNSEVSYAFLDEDPALRSKFHIDPHTGVISAKQTLTYETGHHMHLEITATDKGNPMQSAVGFVELVMGEVRTGVPTLHFQNQTYRIKQRENTSAGTYILKVNAVRSDGRLQRIAYSFGAGNDDGTLLIDTNTGDIKIGKLGTLDYELCQDISRARKITSNQRGRAVFYESDHVNSSSTMENQTFIKNKSRKTNRTFQSYEVCELNFVLLAHTQAQPALYSYAVLTIEIEDENDNVPHFFQQHYSATVKEGNNKGTFVVQVNAFDADAGQNSHILYHIVDGNHDNAFFIEPAYSGVVRTNIVLDREIRDKYKLTVIATDSGIPQMTGTATIHVSIIDVNDNQPSFPPQTPIIISEGIGIGSLIATVTANDVDTYPSLTYRIEKSLIHLEQHACSNEVFTIDHHSGNVIVKNQIDFESCQKYQLSVVASDGAFEDKTMLAIQVMDENDNAPTFKAQYPPTYFATLSNQWQFPGLREFELLTVNATDADSKGRNSKLYYRIEPPVRGFVIDENLGSIKVNLDLLDSDYESDHIYLTIVAHDTGIPSLSGATVVRVNTNSNSTKQTQLFQTQYRTQVNENAPIGTVILRFDQDIAYNSIDFTSLNLTLHIVSGNEDKIFEILAPSTLILSKPLDREQKNLHKLQLVIKENQFLLPELPAPTEENMKGTINVSITVDDFNDNAPQFIENITYAANVSEFAPLRYSIAKILALDADLESSPNSEVVYDITSGNDEGLFAIDLISGVLFVNSKLDFDKGPVCYKLILRACDSAPVALCNVKAFHLSLTDENDNVPCFPLENYFEYVGENEPIGTSIFTALATDLDRGVYGQLTYSIHDTNAELNNVASKYFHIDEKAGLVISNAVYDYEERNLYEFHLKAVDIGGKAATVKVYVQIESKDEYVPQFTERTYHFYINSQANTFAPGYIIGQVTATDRDEGSDGRVIYQLNTQHAFFKINRTTGSIVLKKHLDPSFDLQHDISLVISASSGKHGSLTNMTVVEISFDPLLKFVANSGAIENSDYNMWLTSSLILLFLIITALSIMFLYIHLQRRKAAIAIKPGLRIDTPGNSKSCINTNTFDNVSVSGGINNIGASEAIVAAAMGEVKLPPPKYDGILQYGLRSAGSHSTAATTSELSGSEQSGSSGRGSAEDDGEDEEIRMINECSMHKKTGTIENPDDGRLSKASVQNTQEYLARLGIVDRESVNKEYNSARYCSERMNASNKDSHMHHPSLTIDMYDNNSAAASDIRNLIYVKLNKLTGEEAEQCSNVKDLSSKVSIRNAVDGELDYNEVDVGNGNVGPPMNGSLSSIVHSEEELTGSYNWDYLLDWGPQYQPLANVFSEIACLKEETLSLHSANSGVTSSAKSKHSLGKTKTDLPPQLLTAINPHPSNMPSFSSFGTSSKNAAAFMNMSNMSSLGQHQPLGNVNASFENENAELDNASQYTLPQTSNSRNTLEELNTLSAISPSFVPSLSPLTMNSPSMLVYSGGPIPHLKLGKPTKLAAPLKNDENMQI